MAPAVFNESNNCKDPRCQNRTHWAFAGPNPRNLDLGQVNTQDNLTTVTTTITVTTKRQVVLPKAMCERKKIRPGTSLRISEVGDGFYVTPVPEPTEAELAAVFKALDTGRRTRRITVEDEAYIQEEIKKHRAEPRRRKA